MSKSKPKEEPPKLVEGRRIECSRCWAHPATARLCTCDQTDKPDSVLVEMESGR